MAQAANALKARLTRQGSGEGSGARGGPSPLVEGAPAGQGAPARAGGGRPARPTHPLDLPASDLERVDKGLARFRALGLKDVSRFVDAVYDMNLGAFGGAGAGGDSGVQMLQHLVALPPALLLAYQVRAVLL
jgi:hypothetical protein